MRTLPAFFAALPLIASFAACGSSQTTDDTAPSCYVVSTDYDRTCTTDADCTVVPGGANVCNMCLDGAVACPYCNLFSVNVDAAPAYLTKLHDGIQGFLSAHPGTDCEVPASCPEGTATATCASGLCTGVANYTCGPP